MDISTLTKTGNRECNEDSIGVIQGKDFLSLIVADGLGGQDHGEVASQIAVQTASELFNEADWNDKVFDDYFQNTNDRVLERQKLEEKPQNMMTTVVMRSEERSSIKSYFAWLNDDWESDVSLSFFSVGERRHTYANECAIWLFNFSTNREFAVLDGLLRYQFHSRGIDNTHSVETDTLICHSLGHFWKDAVDCVI